MKSPYKNEEKKKTQERERQILMDHGVDKTSDEDDGKKDEKENIKTAGWFSCFELGIFGNHVVSIGEGRLEV